MTYPATLSDVSVPKNGASKVSMQRPGKGGGAGVGAKGDAEGCALAARVSDLLRE